MCKRRRALELKLNEYLVVGPSIVTDQYGLTNSMVAELFESVSLLLCPAWLPPPESTPDTSALLTCIPAAEVPFTAKRRKMRSYLLVYYFPALAWKQ